VGEPLKRNVRHLLLRPGLKANAILPLVDCEWDEAKAAGNLEKHGVSFEELPLSLLTHSILISMTRTIRLMSIAISLSEHRGRVAY
jgi:hypothetical protein